MSKKVKDTWDYYTYSSIIDDNERKEYQKRYKRKNKPMTRYEYLRYHKNKKYINYCEAIILEDGTVLPAVPSHESAALMYLLLGTEELNYDDYAMHRSGIRLYDELCTKHHMIFLWYDGCSFPDYGNIDITDSQMKTIKLFTNRGLIRDIFNCKEDKNYVADQYLFRK